MSDYYMILIMIVFMYFIHTYYQTQRMINHGFYLLNKIEDDYEINMLKIYKII